MNRTLKETLTKLTLETGWDWVALLPFDLFRARNSPYMLGLTPFEIMFGRPPPIVPSLKIDLIADLPVDAVILSPTPPMGAQGHLETARSPIPHQATA